MSNEKKRELHKGNILVVTDKHSVEEYFFWAHLMLSNCNKIVMVGMMTPTRHKTMSEIVGLLNSLGYIKKTTIYKIENKVHGKKFFQNQADIEFEEIVKNKKKYGR